MILRLFHYLTLCDDNQFWNEAYLYGFCGYL